MMEDSRQVLEPGEIVSFLLTAGTMLLSALFFPAEYWLFIFLTIVDGFATAFRNNTVISVDRSAYALAVLVLGGIALRLSIIPMILETVSVIALIDLLFLVRRMRARSTQDFFKILLRRLESYVYTLVPAAVFSSALIYLGTLALGTSIGPVNAILELGLASIAVFVIILYAAIRSPEGLNRK
jgi:hypothetical protein